MKIFVRLEIYAYKPTEITVKINSAGALIIYTKYTQNLIYLQISQKKLQQEVDFECADVIYYISRILSDDPADLINIQGGFSNVRYSGYSS